MQISYEIFFNPSLNSVCSCCPAQLEIKIEDAVNHVGDSVKVCNKVFGGRYLESVKGLPTFLNVGGYYPNALFTIVIPGEIRKQFKAAPEELYKDLNICVEGRLEMYKGKTIDDIDQLKPDTLIVAIL